MGSGRWAGAVDPYLCSHGVIKLCDGRGTFLEIDGFTGKYGFVGTQNSNIDCIGVKYYKNAIAPVTDTFARQTLRKSLAFVPGIGSTLSAASDLFLAASEVIRSGIGAAALVVLVLLVAVPLSKVGIMTFFTAYWLRLWNLLQINVSVMLFW